MKMKVGTRIVLTVFLLIVIALCVFVILAALGVLPAANLDMLYSGFRDTNFKYLYVVGGLVLLIVAFCLMFFGMTKSAPNEVVLAVTGGGTVSITVEALKELADRSLKETREILVQNIRVRPISERNASIQVDLAFKPESDIPAVSEQVSEKLKDDIEKYSGILISDIKLRVYPLKQG